MNEIRDMVSSLPEAVVFDLDDTLIAYDAVADVSWKAVCRSVSRESEFTERLYCSIAERRAWYWSDAMRHQQGRHDLETARLEIVGAALMTLGCQDQGLAREFVRSYSVVRDQSIHLLPGALDVLSFFKNRGVPLVLVKNGSRDYQAAKIDRFSLSPYFRAILIEGELGFGKPDPCVYEMALDLLGTSPERVWSVGDNLEWDVFAPQRLGIAGIWHDYRRRGLPNGVIERPSRTIHELRELVTLD